MRCRLILFTLLFFPLLLTAQQKNAVLYGKISDEHRHNIDLVNIAPLGTSGGTVSDSKGNYRLIIQADTLLTIQFTFIGYETQKTSLKLKPGEERRLDITLKNTATLLPDAIVRDTRLETGSITRLQARQAQNLTSSSGSGVEDLVKTLPGVSSTNEMSSQYVVRGGNFDENLVYVNGIEIYRPFLIGSGKQEGLSFINSKLVDNIEFSAGGFSAEYGDKLSSALDITYKRPSETAASLSLSFLGAEAHVEGLNNKFSYLVGARYKNTQYILNAMNTKGAYKPNFTDVQALLSYNFNPKLEISALGYYSRNHYLMIPTTGKVTYGAYQASYECNIYYDGQEVDNYVSGMGAVTLNFTPSNQLSMKLIASAYSSAEAETYDVQGEYYIGQIKPSTDSEDKSNITEALGVGAYLEHARNYYYGMFADLNHKGTYIYNDNVLKWGFRYQHQFIDDKVNEWEMVDSTGYTLPYSGNMPGQTTPEPLYMQQVSRGDTTLSMNNMDAFVQHTWSLRSENDDEFLITAGLRSNYWGYNQHFYASPRAGVAYKPNWESDITFRLSGGVYNQMPSYRELRNMDGSIVSPENTAAQRAYQVILGNDYNFMAWNRPFILTTELYYKYLDNIIPYVVDNVRIRYYADQRASGFARGIDMKLYGEFVKGIDSWASLSILSTQEDIERDYILIDSLGNRLPLGISPNRVSDTISVGLIPRPSDQRINFSIFFQDYIPNYPTFKVNLKLVFGSALIYREPYTTPNQYFRDVRPYRRVDIGFSKQFIGEHSSFKNGSPLNHIKNCWLSVEVFNLLDVRNVVSYTWVTDVSGLRHGIPEYLTPRQINLKLSLEF